MQHVEQTGRALKMRFGEHYRRMNKNDNFLYFLYRHFKRKGHSPADILVQLWKLITYDKIQLVDFKSSKDTKPN